MSTLKVENLSKQYEDVTALEDVSFEIEDEFVVLLGESGAGKSTLLRCVNGLTEPTEGSIYLDGEEITGSLTDVGMIFQRTTSSRAFRRISTRLQGHWTASRC